MAQRNLDWYIYPVTINVPKNTTAANPQTTTPKLGDIWVYSAKIYIPTGHKGLTGLYVANNATPLMPFSVPAQFIIGDGEQFDFPIGTEVDSGLKIVTYNTDTTAHTFYVWLTARPMVTFAQQPSSLPVVVVA